MTKTGLISITVALFLITGCSTRNKPIRELKDGDQLTLIFDSAPHSSDINLLGKRVTHKIEFIDDGFIQRQYFPDTTKVFDTLIIKTKQRVFEIRHNYKRLDQLSYLFQTGDTVLFQYHNNTPVAIIINRETKTYDVNFDLFKREKLTPNDYPAFIKFEQPMFFADYSKGFEGADEKVFNLAIKNFNFEQIQEKNLIDSLLQNNLISENISNFFKTRTLFQKKIIELQEKLGFYSIKPIFKRLRNEDFIIQLGFDKELGQLKSGNILDANNDSLLYYSFFQEVINWYNYNYLSRKVGRIKSTNFLNNISTSGSNLADYLPLADTIYENNLLSTNAKNILQFENIQNIIENYSIDEARKAFEKFEREVKDTALVNYVKRKYLLVEKADTLTNDLYLVSTGAMHIKFNDLLEKHKGNVIYIDFWGSYCPPCLIQFKFSSELEQLYKGKKLVQIYISAEPDIKAWLTACKRYNLFKESYFVENRYTSKQLEGLKIKYFPHYLIFDNQGKLVNEFAPRPSEKQIINLLDDYLAK